MGFEVFMAHAESGSGATKFVLSGEPNMATVPILDEYLTRVEADEVAEIVVDLREMTFIDTAGLRAFFAARDRAQANGRQLVLTEAGPPVRRVYEISGFESLLVDQDVVNELDP